ncbi:hypothetical protein Z950_983 [Sulfitobacter mediterraneus KCTC 32188]|jgi:hypothetical protein|nr:hypothetical protein Z950_983 [Sulfitobacter mediterraneus KCTC 32188]
MSNLSGIFMFFASDLARIDIQAAIHLRLASVFQSVVLGNTFACGLASGRSWSGCQKQNMT